MELPADLPVRAVLPEVTAALIEHGTPPGTGKTTTVPLAMAAGMWCTRRRGPTRWSWCTRPPACRGRGEIQRVTTLLDGLTVLPLRGHLPTGRQDAALRPGRERRVVLPTAIAESSLDD